MEVRDSRRLTGPHLLLPRSGAVLDVGLDAAEAERAEAIARAWEQNARKLLEAVGWAGEETAWRVFAGGVSLAFTAPIDALYAATEVNEAAWAATERELATAEASGSGEGSDAADSPERDVAAETPEPSATESPARSTLDRLRAEIDRESNPALLALERAARDRGVAFLWDDDHASVGLGRGSITWPSDELPPPAEVDWAAVHDIPLALVTGTNGKTTTVRLLAAIVEAAGRVPGVSSTDRIRVGREILDEGDWAGPGGARQVLRDRRVEIGILETARGGMLRRGLAVERADVALVTNVAEDHLGEWGVGDLGELADTKMVVARAAERLVLNADNDPVRERGVLLSQPVTWFSLEPRHPLLVSHLAAGGSACYLDGEDLVAADGDRATVVTTAAEIPIALGGAARHNLANALAAVGVARALGLSDEAIRAGLGAFRGTPEENPGRLNVFEVGGVTVIVDFAHNPHGVDALVEMAARLPARRRLLTVGQAGDRDDESIRALARSTWAARPDRVIIKGMRAYLRGRPEGEIPKMIEAELRAVGAADKVIEHVDTDLEAAEAAFRWAREGDLLLLVTHSDRDGVVALVERLKREGWRAGGRSIRRRRRPCP